MITIDGKKYAASVSEFNETLFGPGGTAHGFYKRIAGGVQLRDMQNSLFAFVVDNSYGEQFIVSASSQGDGARYQFGLNDKARGVLGIEGYAHGLDTARDILQQVKGVAL
jgi:hypothetical protein